MTPSPDERPAPLTVHPLPGLPEITTGSDLAALLARSAAAGPGLADGDVLAISSKLVSKALGLRVPWAGDRETREGVVARGTLRVVAERSTPTGTTRVVEAAAGPVMAAAGVDASNTGGAGGLLTLPDDPDAVAAELRRALLARLPGTTRLGVLLTDTAGRPWRAGQTDLALGAAGIAVTDDLRGGSDHDGRPLAVTSRAVADEIAAAADLVKGKDTGIGAVVLRGLPPGTVTTDERAGAPAGARALVRTGPGDWFALGHLEAVRTALGAAPGGEAASRVGIPPVQGDGLPGRVRRALALALLDAPGVEGEHLVAAGPRTPGEPSQDEPPGPHREGSPDDEEGCVVRLRSPDPLQLGRALARLEVAAAAESLRTTWRRTRDGVDATLVTQAPPGTGPRTDRATAPRD